jgi:hypothetical protein
MCCFSCILMKFSFLVWGSFTYIPFVLFIKRNTKMKGGETLWIKFIFCVISNITRI